MNHIRYEGALVVVVMGGVLALVHGAKAYLHPPSAAKQHPFNTDGFGGELSPDWGWAVKCILTMTNKGRTNFIS